MAAACAHASCCEALSAAACHACSSAHMLAAAALERVCAASASASLTSSSCNTPLTLWLPSCTRAFGMLVGALAGNDS
eukprot:363378-Chlamydomonas_euryale.AAC.26